MYYELESIKMILINVQIAVAKMRDNPEAGALTTIASHIESSISNMEQELKEIEGFVLCAVIQK